MSSLSQNLAASGKISGSFQTGKVAGCIPPGPPRYRPPPQPQTQVKTQPEILAQDEKLYDPSSLITSDHLKQFHTVSEFDRGQHIKIAEEANIATGHHKPALVQTNSQDMLKFVRKQEVDNSSRTINEQLRKMSSEIRLLKETNQKLVDDNQELRDLCCFLDDDRQKGRKLAREWQRFGRYTASVMRQEVSAYQNKLRELDTKQQELIKDNLELKELCLYLDEERNGACRSCGAALRRDEGDGSSSSTNPDETTNMPPPFTTVSYHTYHNPQHSAEYVQQLEARVKELEDEKQRLINKGVLSQRNRVISPDFSNQWKLTNLEFHQRPEAVVQALQEQLEMGNGGSETDFCSEEMDEGERALLREMCNVVWRKLEEASQGCRN